jgi:hypothetical protein
MYLIPDGHHKKAVNLFADRKKQNNAKVKVVNYLGIHATQNHLWV